MPSEKIEECYKFMIKMLSSFDKKTPKIAENCDSGIKQEVFSSKNASGRESIN